MSRRSRALLPVACACGRVCGGVRVLTRHHRSGRCPVLPGPRGRLLREFDEVVVHERVGDADRVALARIRDLFAAGDYKAAHQAAWDVDTFAREAVPDRAWLVICAGDDAPRDVPKDPDVAYATIRRAELARKLAGLADEVSRLRAEHEELGAWLAPAKGR